MTYKNEPGDSRPAPVDPRHKEPELRPAESASAEPFPMDGNVEGPPIPGSVVEVRLEDSTPTGSKRKSPAYPSYPASSNPTQSNDLPSEPTTASALTVCKECRHPLPDPAARWCSHCDHLQRAGKCPACKRRGKVDRNPCPHCHFDGHILHFVRRYSPSATLLLAVVALVTSAGQACWTLLAEPDFKISLVHGYDRNELNVHVVNMGRSGGLLQDALFVYHPTEAAAASTDQETDCPDLAGFEKSAVLRVSSPGCDYFSPNKHQICKLGFQTNSRLMPRDCDEAFVALRYLAPGSNEPQCSSPIKVTCSPQDDSIPEGQ